MAWAVHWLADRVPKPIPPPPPQPSAEETVLAVRFLRRILVVAVVAFGLIAGTYGPDNWLVQYGRENAQSWNLYRLDRLDTSDLRDHPGGRIAWLVGSSILRDAFDEEGINTALAAQDSPWRVRKFGMSRGASGLTAPFVEQLPLEPGDRVVHSLAVANFRAEWLEYVGIPADRLRLLLDLDSLWELEEWSLQRKLEDALPWPRAFIAYHEETMGGLESWLETPWRGRSPRARKSSFHLRYREAREWRRTEKALALGSADTFWMDLDDLDLSAGQFNMVGLRRLQAHCAQVDVELMLLDLPQRPQYRTVLMGEGLLAAWQAWLETEDIWYFPAWSEEHYYDLYHSNAQGRARLSTYLVEWLDDPRRGAPVDSSVQPQPLESGPSR